MSPRFSVNFVVLLLGALLVVMVFAFSARTVDAAGLGVGVVAILSALYGFAQGDQGVFQRVAYVIICTLGAWEIVAARVLTYNGQWLEFATGAGLATLGAVGLIVHETRRGRADRIGRSGIGSDQHARLSTTQRDAGVRA